MKKQTLLGLLIITAGVVLFLGNNNIGISKDFIGDWWPLLLIASGLYMLWVNIRSFIWPLIIMGLGLVILVNNLGVADISFGSLFFPVIFVGVGLNILFSSSRSIRDVSTKKSDDNIAAILGGSTSSNESDDYKGGDVTVIMGGAELDLSKVTIKKTAVLNISIIMGGLELRIPDGVKIINRTQSVLGGIEYKSKSDNKESNPTLIIEGAIVMGGVEIKR